ncbi:isochorismate synthase [Flavobacteriaceae bacterium MAR_2010_188]|nr:isochorismate synthase [Flavobacteriaceae bacterium MAR_2010_188]
MNASSIFKELEIHYNSRLPFVAYHKPNSATVKAYLQDTEELHYIKDFSEKGFIMSPFDDSHKTIILPEAECRLIQENLDEIDFEILENSFSDSITLESLQERGRYLELISNTIEYIKNSAVEKIVLSRVEVVPLKSDDIFFIYKRLLKIHPSAFVYICYHPSFGVWLGASPERFLNIERNRLRTVALAGTKNSEAIEWTSKEFREQQLVTDFLVESLKDFVIEVETEKVQTVKAGNLFHLKTAVSGKLKNKDSELQKIIQKLHPTPAVCGVPRDLAKKFIFENENYNREFYTGFLGELNLSTSKNRKTVRRNIENRAFFTDTFQTDLYVNLRCMKIVDGNASIFVGGGITSESIPENEWQETINKTRTIKNVLG